MGELAAFFTACLWATGSLLFAGASRRVGALVVNLIRLTGAGVILWAVCLGRGALAGTPGPREIALLCASGVIGLVLGDSCYFHAMTLIGLRRASLFMSSTPVVTALFGQVFLGERLAPVTVLGIVLTSGGIAWVVLERAPAGGPAAPTTGSTPAGTVLAGSLLGMTAATAQALGLILAKPALLDLGALPATVVRMSAAIVVGWTIALVRGIRVPWRALLQPPLPAMLLAATVMGPVLGVWLSLVAVRLTETAVAATLMALVPVLVIPLVMVVHGERPSLRAVLGALVAVAGVALVLARPAGVEEVSTTADRSSKISAFRTLPASEESR